MSESDRFLELFDSLRKEFVALRNRPMDSNAIEDYQSIDRQFTAMLEDPSLGDGGRVLASCERNAERLDEDYGELEMELEQLQELLAHEEEELSRRMGSDYVEQVVDVSEELGKAQDKRTYQSYCTSLADLAGGLSLAKTVFDGVLAKSVTDIQEERVSSADVRFADPANWASRREHLSHLMNDVQAKASQLNLSPPAKEESLFMEVDALAQRAAQHIAAGVAERKKRDDQLVVFYGECDKLTQWCHQQLANLDAMQEPDHIQEYCGTLVDNYATMSSNFAVLVASVQPYVRDNHQAVRQALLDVDQSWYCVMVTALERLSKTLFEIHPKSRLEDEVEKYAAYPKHLMELLKTVRTFLQHEQDLSEEGQAVLQDCERLCDAVVGPKEAASVKRLKAFARRARANREGYQCFREAILSRLTYAMRPADVVLDSKRRQMEFEECTKELRTWAAAQAHGESWRDIYSKIVEIKRVIEQEQAYVDERAGEPVN